MKDGRRLLREGVQKDSEVGSVGRGIVLEGLLESEVGRSRKGRMSIGGGGGYGRIWLGRLGGEFKVIVK